jgi:hypothetical protein
MTEEEKSCNKSDLAVDFVGGGSTRICSSVKESHSRRHKAGQSSSRNKNCLRGKKKTFKAVLEASLMNA